MKEWIKDEQGNPVEFTPKVTKENLEKLRVDLLASQARCKADFLERVLSESIVGDVKIPKLSFTPVQVEEAVDRLIMGEAQYAEFVERRGQALRTIGEQSGPSKG